MDLENMILHVHIEEISDEKGIGYRNFNQNQKTFFLINNYNGPVGRDIAVRTWVYDKNNYKNKETRKYYDNIIPCDFISHALQIDMKPQYECLLVGIMEGFFGNEIAPIETIKETYSIWNMDYYVYAIYDDGLKAKILKNGYEVKEMDLLKAVKRQRKAHPCRPRVLFINQDFFTYLNNTNIIDETSKMARLTPIYLEKK